MKDNLDYNQRYELMMGNLKKLLLRSIMLIGGMIAYIFLMSYIIDHYSFGDIVNSYITEENITNLPLLKKMQEFYISIKTANEFMNFTYGALITYPYLILVLVVSMLILFIILSPLYLLCGSVMNGFSKTMNAFLNSFIQLTISAILFYSTILNFDLGIDAYSLYFLFFIDMFFSLLILLLPGVLEKYFTFSFFKESNKTQNIINQSTI